MVLPPIGPLFTSNPHRQLASETPASSSSAQGVTTSTHELLLNSLRTPTGIYAHAYLSGAFPSSSPVKKDMHTAGGILAASTAKKNYASKKSAAMSVLSLDSPKSHSSSLFADAASSPTCEDEKLRLSRERNRLHAQRTRIRKRELLESLKERIQALQCEHGLLKQAYEFHATAVCLLSLGNECDHPSIKRLEEVSDAAMELFDTTTKLHACLDDDEDIDEDVETNSVVVHEKGCEYYDDNDQDSHSDSGASCSCSSADHESAQLNGNGKRLHSTSALLGSKEEREQLRRERNRLHARRARLRKKLVLERSQQAVQELRKRNELLRERLTVLISSIYGANQLCS
uniref:BZIP domain-containing protein n=1 Tax=Globisporangium ultimum (strain ATCC 200006 / CBS 805.95 / DAOM BR144) TaxID=431595 RepID=K3WA94_GLOUD